MAREKQLEYQHVDLGFRIKNITYLTYELFGKIHFAIYKDSKPLPQIESELEYIKQRLDTGEWKAAESYPESDFTEEEFDAMVEEHELENQ